MLWRKDTYKPLLNIYGDQGNYNDPIKFWCRNDNNLYDVLLHRYCFLMGLGSVHIEDGLEAD